MTVQSVTNKTVIGGGTLLVVEKVKVVIDTP